MPRLPFILEHTPPQPETKARAGRLTTLHNEVLTPIFMPVGTQATVKSQTPDGLLAVGAKILLANTYHLLLRPGPEVFKKLGGIHSFMAWPNSVLTDSGGYQIFSLEKLRMISEEGAKFQSYVDGQTILLTPESSIETQLAIRSDIMMALDQCVPSTCDENTAKQALDLTTRWAKRSLKARGESPQALFGIVQGACFEHLRKQSAEQICDMAFDGFAIGGLAVGEGKSEREDFCEFTANLLPADRPRYLMGVGTPIDLLEAVHRGVDMFDCIIPTNFAQRGVVFTSRGKIQVKRNVYKLSDAPLDPECGCSTCAKFSIAYLHHLSKSSENLGWTLLAYHNLWFYQRLMAEMRRHIIEGTFYPYYLKAKVALAQGDLEFPVTLPKRKRKTKQEEFTLGDYQIVLDLTSKVGSIRQISSGETMHSVVEPMLEARNLYVHQSKIISRLTREPIVLWDVGLGAATNVMATILTLESNQELNSDFAKAMSPLQIFSFEMDLDPLKLALSQPRYFPQAQHPAAHTLLQKGIYHHPLLPIEWTLISGDFAQTFQNTPNAQIIYFDPFSLKTNRFLWSKEFLTDLRIKLSIDLKQNTELFTYSNSTEFRSSALAAGFFVAVGAPTGPKKETTIAALLTAPRPLPLEREWLNHTWLTHWERSSKRYFEQEVRSHSQFTGQYTNQVTGAR